MPVKEVTKGSMEDNSVGVQAVPCNWPQTMLILRGEEIAPPGLSANGEIA